MNTLAIALMKSRKKPVASQPSERDELEDLVSEFQSAETPAEKAAAFRAMVSAARTEE